MCIAGQRVSLTITGPGPSFIALVPTSDMEAEAGGGRSKARSR